MMPLPMLLLFMPLSNAIVYSRCLTPLFNGAVHCRCLLLEPNAAVYCRCLMPLFIAAV
jgi:hypothetical protein